jgi:hypothetical protein
MFMKYCPEWVGEIKWLMERIEKLNKTINSKYEKIKHLKDDKKQYSK